MRMVANFYQTIVYPIVHDTKQFVHYLPILKSFKMPSQSLLFANFFNKVYALWIAVPVIWVQCVARNEAVKIDFDLNAFIPDLG